MTTPLTWELVDSTAKTLGATAVQRRKWRQTGRQVPPAWRIRITDALREAGTPIETAAFDDLPPRPGRLGEGASS